MPAAPTAPATLVATTAGFSEESAAWKSPMRLPSESVMGADSTR